MCMGRQLLGPKSLLVLKQGWMGENSQMTDSFERRPVAIG
jgi:hypothetical protein